MGSNLRHLFAFTLILPTAAVIGNDSGLSRVQIKSSADASMQPARWFAPAKANDEAVPLLVLLHTWSGDYRQNSDAKVLLPECDKRGWALIVPNFRGPNNHPDACASKLAVADVLDAVAFAKANAKIDPSRIYLVGTSGGGHMALVMAHSAPQVWAGVSSWVPVVDLAAWHAETKQAGRKYWKEIEAVCGGPPGVSAEIDAQYRARSPLFHLNRAKGLPIDLNVGIHDGHTGSIPVTHSLLAFNALAEANDAKGHVLNEKVIRFIRDKRAIPGPLADEREDDSDRKRRILFRRKAGPARLTVFDGGHEGDMPTALRWLADQEKQGVDKPVESCVADEQRPPNFVIVFTDDQGYGDLGCFGSKDIRTPRIDLLAKEGMRFTSFYAQPVCGPSRAALMTGCYPLRVAERGNIKEVHPVLHTKEITIAEVLKEQGYASGCFGKWDLARHSQKGFHKELLPTRQGFDYFFGTPTSNDGFVDLYRNEELIENKTDMNKLTRRYTDEAIAFIEKHHDQPFFVYLPHTMPHTRLGAGDDFRGKSKRGLYGDVIEEIDFETGRIVDAINRLELADNTCVIFTSDNGPWLIKNKNHRDGIAPVDHGGSAGPLRSGKVSTWEGGVRVPTVVWAPGRVPAGETCDEIATTMDIFPTLAKLAGGKIPEDRTIDGEDITHLLRGEFEQANSEKVYFYYFNVKLEAVRQGRWKLHLPRPAKQPWLPRGWIPNRHIAPADRLVSDAPLLFNLQEDLGETTDVSAKHPDVVKNLLALAESARADIGDYDRIGEGARFFDEGPKRPAAAKWQATTP